MADISKKVDFNLIRYANCWEDAEVLLKGLDPREGTKILSIGSAGDNSFSLLTKNPDLVVAVDVNVIQLYLIALKKAAIQLLDYDQVLGFLGFRPCTERIHLFHQIKTALEPDALTYWEQNTQTIAQGIVHQGKFEKYFQLFSRKVLPFIHSKNDIEQLLATKDDLEQSQYYYKHWNTWRWRLFFSVFFSKFVMGRFGRDPVFLREVEVDVSSYIFKKAEKHLKKKQAQQNPFLRYNLTGDFGDLLPHYLRKENFNQVKSSLKKLIIRQGFAEDIAQEFGQFDYMNLSNIFEYMDKELFKQTASKLVSQLNIGGRIAYWNLMVPRRVSGVFPSEIAYLNQVSQELSQEDNGFFYNQFIVEQK